MNRRLLLLIILLLVLVIFAVTYRIQQGSIKISDGATNIPTENTTTNNHQNQDEIVDLTKDIAAIDEQKEQKDIVDLRDELKNENNNSTEIKDISNDINFGDIDASFNNLEADIINQ